MIIKNSQTILYFSNTGWDRIKQRPQHLAEQLAKKYKVIYIDMVYSLTDSLAATLKLSDKKIPWRLKGEVKQINQNLHIYYPLLLLPLARIQAISSLNNIILGYFVKKLLKKQGIEADILWLSNPRQFSLVSRLKHKLLYYDIMDDYPLFSNNRFIRKQIADMHRSIVDKADRILVSARELGNEIGKEKDIYLIPNAVDTKIFDGSQNYTKPNDLKKIAQPVIGCVSYIGEWIDLDNVKSVALKNKNWSFVFIGPIHRNIEPYQLDNIHFLGKRDHHDLPSYISHFDVCLVPFIVNELTNKVNPVKMFEYLAMNKPVIASNTRELKKYQDYCHLYKNSSDLEKLIKQTLAAKTFRKDQIRSFLQKNTWQWRGICISKIIDKSLA